MLSNIEKDLRRRRRHIVPRIFLNLPNIPIQITILALHKLRLLQQFPPNKQNREHPNHRVREQKGRDVPHSGEEDRIATDESHDEAAGQSIVGEVRLEFAPVGEFVAGEALGFAGFAEADEGEGHDREVDELASRDL